jgi:hypothetical protein
MVMIDTRFLSLFLVLSSAVATDITGPRNGRKGPNTRRNLKGKMKMMGMGMIIPPLPPAPSPSDPSEDRAPRTITVEQSFETRQYRSGSKSVRTFGTGVGSTTIEEADIFVLDAPGFNPNQRIGSFERNCVQINDDGREECTHIFCTEVPCEGGCGYLRGVSLNGAPYQAVGTTGTGPAYFGFDQFMTVVPVGNRFEMEFTFFLPENLTFRVQQKLSSIGFVGPQVQPPQALPCEADNRRRLHEDKEFKFFTHLNVLN